jgi:hypothetical protein
LSRDQRQRSRLHDETSPDFGLESLEVDDTDNGLLSRLAAEIDSSLTEILPELEADRSIPFNMTDQYHRYPRRILDDTDPRYLVDGHFDPHANDVTDRTLQRETPIRGHGGGEGGRKREKPIRKQIAVMMQDESETNPDTVRFNVYGLTVGEKYVLTRVPGRSKDILSQAVLALIARNGYADQTVPSIRGGKRLHSFAVYGLEEYEARILRLHRGFAVRSLIAAAHAIDAELICAIDGDWARDRGTEDPEMGMAS